MVTRFDDDGQDKVVVQVSSDEEEKKAFPAKVSDFDEALSPTTPYSP